MIAMLYRFTLPADYDMAIVDRRIRDKAPLLDNLPNLSFKAYLTARKTDTEATSAENLYAPFYLWENEAGLSDFLGSPAFQALTDAFGWPEVRTWVVWHSEVSEDIRTARFATREISAIAPHSPLAALRQAERDAVSEDMQNHGALAAVTGFEPTGWTRLRFRLWRDLPDTAASTDAEIYRLGHLSHPGKR